MQNIIGYIEDTLRTIDDTGFNPVDSLILSELSYLQFDGIVPQDGEAVPIGEVLRAELFNNMLRNVPDRNNNKQMIYRLAASPRFRNIPMLHYISECSRTAEKQFAALTYFLPDGTAYVAYRGTDTTIIGWKEDFKMAYICPVPAQKAGVEYLNMVGMLTGRPLRVGGHSKGGNIAVYSSMMCSPEVRRRITDVYSHDGPGFREEIINCKEFRQIESRIRKTVPQSSLIGMLLQNQEHFDMVESSSFWIMQHDPFSWRVRDSGFIYTEKQPGGAAGHMNRALNEWINSLTDEEREKFVDALFRIVSATGAETFTELSADWRRHMRVIFQSMKDLDRESKEILRQIVRELASMAVKNLKFSIEPKRIKARLHHASDTKRKKGQ